MGRRARPALSAVALALSLLVCASGMEITVPAVVYALNGSDIRLPCNFNSCYKMDTKQFSMNWTYRGCENCTEETHAITGYTTMNACAPSHCCMGSV
ncbi:hypothetical protein GDO78_011278 [Eleutherodactylus coqui]|uniref:Uncharacterized protein n=1 Tax=Eleutherodactylus coqui TaxID=57060 RepID=A0A8J6F834_ELECQ|nr:hypothetical protein GDO78_011278 [Eleutherodactylus coqui]